MVIIAVTTAVKNSVASKLRKGDSQPLLKVSDKDSATNKEVVCKPSDSKHERTDNPLVLRRNRIVDNQNLQNLVNVPTAKEEEVTNVGKVN